MLLGPWSLDWLHDHIHGDAGVISSSHKKSKHKASISAGIRGKKKAGGLLRHSVYILKKVSRLPTKDMSNVLKVIERSVRKRRGLRMVIWRVLLIVRGIVQLTFLIYL